jgi:hypothetical protein
MPGRPDPEGDLVVGRDEIQQLLADVRQRAPDGTELGSERLFALATPPVSAAASSDRWSSVDRASSIRPSL